MPWGPPFSTVWHATQRRKNCSPIAAVGATAGVSTAASPLAGALSAGVSPLPQPASASAPASRTGASRIISWLRPEWARRRQPERLDRASVVEGKRESGRVVSGGRRKLEKKKHKRI